MSFAQHLCGEAALEGSFDRGLRLADGGGVLSRSTPPSVTGCSVRSPQGVAHRVYATLDLDDVEVVDCRCDCPVDGDGTGMCEHAVALVLRHFADADIEPLPGGAPGAPTSPQIAGLLSAVVAARLASVVCPHGACMW